MKRIQIIAALVLITLIPCFCDSLFGQRGRGAPPVIGGGVLVVAASNAAERVKNTAWKVCDGTNDEVEIQAAIDHVTPVDITVGSAVVLSEGLFNIEAVIDLKKGVTIRGQGNNVTILYLVSGSNCDMFEFDEIGGSSTFLTIRDVLLYGNDAGNTSGIGLHFKVHCKDLMLKNVFVDDFDEDGMHIHGAWGHVYDNVIVEFCGEDGIHLAGKNEYTLTGDTLTTASVALGETYTQATSDASGRALAVGTVDVTTTLIVTTDDDTNPLDGTNAITFSGGGAYTPTSIPRTAAAGPKISNCKIMDNAGDQLYAQHQLRLVVRNSEFNTLGATSAIVLEYTRTSAIQNNVFNTMTDAGTAAYIEINADASNLGSLANIISGNVFNVDQNSKYAITSDHNNNIANLITNNVVLTGHAASGIFDETSSQRRNKIVNNYLTSTITSGVGTSYQDYSENWEMYDIPNNNYTGFNYANGLWHSNVLHDATRVVTLPLASHVGMEYKFVLEAAQALRIDCNGSDTIYLNDGDGTFTATSSAGEYVWADAIGEYIVLRCLVVNRWYAIEQGGTWTEE